MVTATKTAGSKQHGGESSAGFSWKYVVAGVALVALFVLWMVLPLQEWIRSGSESVRQLGLWGALGYGLAYVLAVPAMVPGSALTIPAGLIYGLWKGFLLVIISATSGACLAFLIVRYAARDALAKKFQDHPKFNAIDRAVKKEGWKVVALMRLSPLVPFNAQNYLFGLTDIKFSHYALATFLGMMPGTLLYVYLGALGRVATAGQDTTTLKWVFFGLGLVATAVVAILLGRKAKQFMATESDIVDNAKQRNDEKQRDNEEQQKENL